MSNPWPSGPYTPINQVNEELEKRKRLDEMLVKWQAAKSALEQAKEAEMDLRKACFALAFTNPKEGVNNLELGSGYVLKGGRKVNYSIKAPEGFDGTAVDAADNCAEAFAKIAGVEGSVIAERLFKFSVDMSVTEYRLLAEDAKVNQTKAKLLSELNKVLEIKDGSPTLEIREPKSKK